MKVKVKKMNGKDLIEGLSKIDEKYIHEADSKEMLHRVNHRWIKIGILASSCVVIGMSGYWLINRNSGNLPFSFLNSSIQYDSVVFQRANQELTRDIYIEGHFWQELSETEMQAVFPSLSKQYNVIATANFSKINETISLYDVQANIQVDEILTAQLTLAPQKIAKCYELDGKMEPSLFHGIQVQAGYFDRTSNGKTINFADFEIDGTFYYLEMAGMSDQQTDFLKVIEAIIIDKGVDFSLITPIPPAELRDDSLTFDEAKQDITFGQYMPERFPSGFEISQINRFVNQQNNYLWASLYKGMDSFRWSISMVSEDDKERITSISDTTNYDLLLYPIPRAETIPSELREIVNDPIFLIDELTLEAVKMRSYTVNESGDSNGERMYFSVLYEDVLVSIDSKGVSSEEVYQLLLSIK